MSNHFPRGLTDAADILRKLIALKPGEQIAIDHRDMTKAIMPQELSGIHRLSLSERSQELCNRLTFFCVCVEDTASGNFIYHRAAPSCKTCGRAPRDDCREGWLDDAGPCDDVDEITCRPCPQR